MADYQNLFTQVQAVTHPHSGAAIDPRDMRERTKNPFLWHLAGRLGNAQIGPLYLGWVGLASAICFMIAFTIVGWNMLVQVNYDPIQFVRQLFWLSLDPPPPEYGLKLAPLKQGGWWNIAGFFSDGIDSLVVGAGLSAGTGIEPGHPCGLGIRSGHLAVSGVGFLSADSHGQLVGGRAVWNLLSSRLDSSLLDSVRKSFL